MRYALIGCGRISPNHLAAANNNGLDIVALCDCIPENMAKAAKDANLTDTRLYTSYHEMLEKERPQLVAIATESGKHAAIALDCINFGCNVIIEKPIALSLADARKIISAGKERGVKVSVCHQNRFNKPVQKIRQAVEDGRFGRLLHGTAQIRWNRGKNYYEQAPWRGTWEQDGGALMNQCIHNIDLLRWMLGDEISEVVAFTDRLNHPYIQAEDLGLGLVRFKNGAYGMVEGTTNIYPHNMEETLCIFGEKATAKAGGKSLNLLETWLVEGEDSHGLDEFNEAPPNVYGFGHTPLYADVIEAVTKNREPYVDAEAGTRALELVLGIYKSAAEGRAVTFPLDDCSTLDFLGRWE